MIYRAIARWFNLGLLTTKPTWREVRYRFWVRWKTRPFWFQL